MPGTPGPISTAIGVTQTVAWDGITVTLYPPFDPSGVTYSATLPGYTNARRVHQQWDVCARCGNEFPMAELTMQLGILVCMRYCWDNLENYQRPARIVRTITGGDQREGTDRRYEERGNFYGQDLEVY